MQVPDNYSAFESYEHEQERYDRIHKKQIIEDEIEKASLPFYDHEIEPNKKVRRNTYYDTI